MFSFLFILFIGLAMRLFLIGNTGFIADISFWKSWSLAAIDHGIVWTALNTNINYPPGFIYVLYLMGKIYSLFGNPHDYNSFWMENNFSFLLASKSIAIASDLAIAVLIYWFFSQKEKLVKLGFKINSSLGKNLPLILSSIFFLNPVVILDSSVWGQVESFGILFTLIAIILIFYNKPNLATAIFAVGTLMKLQNIIYIPLLFLFIARFYDFKTLIKSLGAFALAFFLVNLPFILANKMDQVVYLLTVNSDYFPWLSLNAHNLWWIVSGAKGMAITDRITVLSILNAKTVGLFLFASFYLLPALLLYKKPSAKNLFLALSVGIFAFFLFSTQSHERYSYPVVVFLIFFYPFFVSANPSKHLKTVFLIIYALLTFSFFLNMHTGLVVNYPNNGINWLTHITTPALTILNSYVIILLFLFLLPFVFSQISKLYTLLSFTLFISLVTFSQFSYFTSGQVSLTFFKPTITKQDFGVLQTNMSANSSDGWKKWNRLSDDYFFYRKGFGTHANSYLVFDINRKFSSFATDFGIDTEAGTEASAVFKIYGDGKLLFTSEKKGRFDFPGHAKVIIKDVKKLELVVTDAGDGINNDHADWLNPILYK